MAMVYGAVQQSRGHVEVHAELGRGTRVEIVRPAAHGVAARMRRLRPDVRVRFTSRATPRR